jgi:cytoskeletal protein CcmA (bactofilin family)
MFNRKANGGSELAASDGVADRNIAPPPPYTGASAPRATPATTPSTTAEGVVVIGKGTRIVGEITQCAKLEIQGEVEGTIIADSLIVRESGVVKGELQATQAEIHGNVRGRLDVRDVLDVRGTGRVEGELSYGRLAVAMGGFISGTVSGETEAAQSGTVAPATDKSPFASQLNGSSSEPTTSGYTNGTGYTNGAALS